MSSSIRFKALENAREIWAKSEERNVLHEKKMILSFRQIPQEFFEVTFQRWRSMSTGDGRNVFKNRCARKL
jgi:hypothetical protein